MKALVCKAYGEPSQLVYEELPSPVPGPGEGSIAVQCIGMPRPPRIFPFEEAGEILHRVVTNQIREKVVLTTRYWQEQTLVPGPVYPSQQEKERLV